MTMSHNGLTKLIEECGEVIQVAAKMQAFPHGAHPDGGPPLRERLSDELADVFAACSFCIETHGLDQDSIGDRAERKLETFRLWHADLNA